MFIEGKNLVKKYGKGEATVFALDHTDFSMEKGEIVVILGPSGSGKSTLLNILGGLDKVTEGSMLVEGKDLEGIVSQLRLTAGVEVAIFIYEMQTQLFKVSLRSNGKVDVSKIAVFFGGGGHVRAAGCDMQGSMYDVINNLTAEIEKQLAEE